MQSLVWNDKPLDMDGGAGRTAMLMYLMPLNCSQKLVKMVYFVLRSFITVKEYKEV